MRDALIQLVTLVSYDDDTSFAADADMAIAGVLAGDGAIDRLDLDDKPRSLGHWGAMSFENLFFKGDEQALTSEGFVKNFLENAFTFLAQISLKEKCQEQLTKNSGTELKPEQKPQRKGETVKAVAMPCVFEISCLLTHDKAMQVLNKEHRGRDAPTNVLSFGYLKTPFCFETFLTTEDILSEQVREPCADHAAYPDKMLPSDESEPCFQGSLMTKEPVILGDIVLSYETIATEAQTQQKTFQNHLAHLLVHGLLHLLGYDHEQEGDALIMENLERLVLQKFGISDPYESENDPS